MTKIGMNYQIISDEKQLRDFIDWLPELQEHEKYYCSLFARKKYCPDGLTSRDKTQLKRFISDKDRLFDKIKQLEVELGAYQLSEKPAPQESLVLYINPNPRNLKQATFNVAKRCLQLIEEDKQFNIQSETMTCIHHSKSKGHFVDFDIDTKDVDLSLMKEIMPPEHYTIIETRGGYHVLVHSRTAPKTNWFKAMQATFPLDQTGDNMIPVVGAVQGGFTPRFVN